MSISDSSTALICHTNRPIDANDGNSGGDWFAPNGNWVTSTTGFIQRRVGKTVQLRRSTATPSVGIYHCVIRDDTDTEQTVYVGLYNRGRGGIAQYTMAVYNISLLSNFRDYHIQRYHIQLGLCTL